MEVSNPLQEILDLLNGVKELVDFFKGKDKWFLKCHTYLTTLFDIISKYKENHKPGKPVPNVFHLMKGDLEIFKSYLEKEKKISQIDSSFKGSSMVREGEDHISRIDHHIYFLNIDVQLENQEDANKKLETLIKKNSQLSSNIISRFKDKKAGAIWALNLGQEEEIPFNYFKIFLMKLGVESHKMDLNQERVDIILETMDANHNHLIRFDEWDMFYTKFWTNISKLEEIWSCPIIKDKFYEMNLNPFIFKICKVNKFDEKAVTYEIGHEFIFSKEKYSYYDYNGNEIVRSIDWQKNSVVVGKEKDGASEFIMKPDICCHPQSSINFKQFLISYKTFINSRGFYIKNLSTGHPTCLKVEKTPYVLEPGMIFILPHCHLLIEQVNFSNAAVEPTSTDYFFLNLSEKEEDTSVDLPLELVSPKKKKQSKEENKSPGKKKSKIEAISLTVQVISSEAHNTQTFDVQKLSEEFTVKVGSDEACEILNKELAKLQMKFRYSPKFKLWFAVTDEECIEKGGLDKLDNYVVLMDGKDFLNIQEPISRAGSISVAVRKGMKICFNGNELQVVEN